MPIDSFNETVTAIEFYRYLRFPEFKIIYWLDIEVHNVF